MKPWEGASRSLAVLLSYFCIIFITHLRVCSSLSHFCERMLSMTKVCCHAFYFNFYLFSFRTKFAQFRHYDRCLLSWWVRCWQTPLGSFVYFSESCVVMVILWHWKTPGNQRNRVIVMYSQRPIHTINCMPWFVIALSLPALHSIFGWLVFARRLLLQDVFGQVQVYKEHNRSTSNITCNKRD